MAALVLREREEVSDTPAPPLVVGRQSELSEIQALIDGAQSGDGGAIVVHGERGVGKSTVLEMSASLARELKIFRCTAFQSESELAHAGLHQLVWPLLHHIDALPDVQAAALRGAIGNSDAPGDRLLVGAALLTLLSDVA